MLHYSVLSHFEVPLLQVWRNSVMLFGLRNHFTEIDEGKLVNLNQSDGFFVIRYVIICVIICVIRLVRLYFLEKKIV